MKKIFLNNYQRNFIIKKKRKKKKKEGILQWGIVKILLNGSLAITK